MIKNILSYIFMREKLSKVKGSDDFLLLYRDCANFIASNKNIFPYTTENLKEILKFWLVASYSYEQMTYRPETAQENLEYAFVDYLACYKRGARNPDTISSINFWQRGITNIYTYFEKLLDEGYLQNANIYEILNAEHTIPELKVIADSLGVSKTGNKDTLISNIVPALSTSDIDCILAESHLYALSEKGMNILQNNADYVLLHKYISYVPLSAFNDYRFPPNCTRRRNFYDTMFQFYSAQIAFYEWKHNYHSLGLAHLALYKIMMEESKKTTHSVPFDLVLLHYVYYLYLSSCFCLETKHINEFAPCYASRNIRNFILPTPDVDLYKICDFEKFINYAVIFNENPPSYLSHEEFMQYVHEMLNEPAFDQNKWNTIIQCKVASYILLMKP